MTTELNALVINHATQKPGTSVLDVELIDKFHIAAGGSAFTVERRLSRLMAKLYREKKLNRRRISPGPGNDGTRWVYAYDRYDL